MRKANWLAITLTAAALGGCQGNPSANPPTLHSTALPPDKPVASTEHATTASSSAGDIIATVGDIKMARGELETPLLEAYGFNTLMLLIQRDMARQACTEAGITITPTDVDSEWKWTLDRMFQDNQGEDRQKLLDQFLAQPKTPGQASTRTEMNVIIETNTYLRKLAEPSMKMAITDDVLHQAFDEQYGAQARVRHIAVANPTDAVKYRAMLEAGQDFARLARQVSLDTNTASIGGELPPFTMNSTKFPAGFKKAAFALKPGEISEPVAADGSWHLIRLDALIQPKAVKFEDVKDSLRDDLQEKAVFEAVKSVRAKLAQSALEQMKISDPVLKAEFDKRLGVRDSMIKDREKIREQLDKERAARLATPAATQAASQPAPAPATTRSSVPAVKPAIPPTSTQPAIPAVSPAAQTPAMQPTVQPTTMPTAPATAVMPSAPPATTPPPVAPAHPPQATTPSDRTAPASRPATMP